MGGMAHPPEEADGGVEAACNECHLDGAHVVLLLLVRHQSVLGVTAGWAGRQAGRRMREGVGWVGVLGVCGAQQSRGVAAK